MAIELAYEGDNVSFIESARGHRHPLSDIAKHCNGRLLCHLRSADNHLSWLDP